MTLQYINLEDLTSAKLNVRKKGAKEIGDLLPSIRSLGLLQPLLVRPSTEGYEVVAGQRRYHALQKLAEEADDCAADPVPCIVMAEGDDAKAIEASLAENIARLPMDEIDQYKAFAALVKQGEGAADIAARFGVTERLVRQRLAIANLIAPILTAYRKDDICAATVRILTMATKAQQKKWAALFASEEEYAPEGYRLKCWLFGGESIPTANALFDLEGYDGAVTSDLFDEDSYFADAETFWQAQNTAIAALKEHYLADGWTDVTVLEVGEHFPSYDYIDTAKEDGGKVFIKIAHDGEVTAYEGQLSRNDVKKRDKAEAGEDTASKPKAELTKAMQTLLNLHRHSSTRTALLNHPAIALRLAVAQIIAGSELWTVQADPQKSGGESVADSLAANKAEGRFSAERKAVFDLLGLDGCNDATLVCRKEDWRLTRDLHAIFARLLILEDADVTRILTFVVAETLPCGSALIEALGLKLDVDIAEDWMPDDAFFDLLRDKSTINTMLKQVAGKQIADAHLTETAKVQKQVLRRRINAKAETDKPWKPNYLNFPMKPYLRKDGLQPIDTWEAVKAAYAA